MCVGYSDDGQDDGVQHLHMHPAQAMRTPGMAKNWLCDFPQQHQGHVPMLTPNCFICWQHVHCCMLHLLQWKGVHMCLQRILIGQCVIKLQLFQWQQ
jgi:hypothetical protein